jgi:hypothetical protein
VVETGASPWAHIEKNVVDIAETVEPKDCLIDPAVNGDIRGIEDGRFTNGDGAAGVGLSCAFAGPGSFGYKWGWIEA